MLLWTDYPLVELGDQPNTPAPQRRCTLLSYDGNKYCTVLIDGNSFSIKRGYIYYLPIRDVGRSVSHQDAMRYYK